MFGREILENAVRDHPDSVPARVLLENFHHFEAIHSVLNGKWIHGWGSYMFNGQEYIYQRETLKKQEALFRVGQISRNVLEVGVYVGHSLLILLASNPSIRITCIDNDSRYTPKVVDYLNSQFHNRVTFILGDAVEIMKTLPSNTYDAIHIDADHNIPALNKQFTETRRLAINGGFIVFDDYESLRTAIDGWISEKILHHVVTPWCLWTNIVTNIVKN
jgi:spermidine synthase